MTEKIKINFLGTAAAIPTPSRNHTGILLSYKSENILIDCGEGIQRQFRKAGISPTKITKLLITHWHGDHVLGIPGLLQTLAFSDYNKTLFIYGPKGTKDYMKEMLKTFVFSGKIKFEIKEILKDGIFFKGKDFYLEASLMTHTAKTYAYNLIKEGQLRIDKQKLKKSGIPQGPILKRLKEGKDITHNGKKYKARDLTYTEGNKKVSVILDTSLNGKIIKFAEDSDLLIMESSYDSELTSQAKLFKHMTSKQVGEIAKQAKVKKLFLTHVSNRYDKNLNSLLNESKKYFKDSHLAKDLDVVNV